MQMKKLFSAALICLMLLSSLTVNAWAEKGDLPFALDPPANVSAVWLEGNDSPTTMQIAYSLNNEMTAFFQKLDQAAGDGTVEEFLSEYDFDEIWMTCQIDWAIDDVDDPVSGWHYTEYWDGTPGFGLGYDDEGYIRVSEWDGVDLWLNNAAETVQELWIMRGVPSWAFYGDPNARTPGVRDQLRPEQYTYDENEESLSIDFTEHAAYFRARFVVTTRTDDGETPDQFYYSDWSEACSVGRDAAGYAPLTEADLPAPVISDLHMTDKTFNDNPVVAFTLTVPDELAANATRVAAAGGGIYIDTEARVKGDAEWTAMGNTDGEVKAGELECALLHLVSDERPNIPADTEIELRCRYRCYQPGTDEDVFSAYSEVISFGTDNIHQGDDPAPISPAPDDPAPDAPAAAEKKACQLCHFCPQPLGLCIFIWLAILLVVIVVIVILVRRSRKKNGK